MRFTSPSRGFVLLYALAYAGLFVSFIPFVSVLLPLKSAAVGEAQAYSWLSAGAFGGAAVASIANILFGALSDHSYVRRGTRRPWIAAGLGVLILAYGLLLWSADGTSLLFAVGVLQVAINMMFAPALAIVADEVPDERKGLMTGLMGAAHPIASLVAAGMMLHGLGGWSNRYGLLCAAIAAMVLPFLIFTRERSDPLPAPPPREKGLRRADLARVWFARMLVQIAGNALSTYGLFYFLAVLGEKIPDKGNAEAAGGGYAEISAAVTIVALLVTIGAGRLSDVVMRRKPFLMGGALVMAGGMVLMAEARDWWVASLGYGAAMAGMSVFLAAQSALAMQLLPSPDHRGRDLGILNLTNTLPAMLAPLLALALSPQRMGFDPLLLTLALGVLAGGAVSLGVRSEA